MRTRRSTERVALLVGLGVRGAEKVQELAPGGVRRARLGIEVEPPQVPDQGAMQAGRIAHVARWLSRPAWGREAPRRQCDPCSGHDGLRSMDVTTRWQSHEVPSKHHQRRSAPGRTCDSTVGRGRVQCPTFAGSAPGSVQCRELAADPAAMDGTMVLSVTLGAHHDELVAAQTGDHVVRRTQARDALACQHKEPPTACPRLSLTRLKPSRRMNRTPDPRPARAPAVRTGRGAGSARPLGSPVNVSLHGLPAHRLAGCASRAGHVDRPLEHVTLVVRLGVCGAEDVQELAPSGRGRTRPATASGSRSAVDQWQPGRLVHPGGSGVACSGAGSVAAA